MLNPHVFHCKPTFLHDFMGLPDDSGGFCGPVAAVFFAPEFRRLPLEVLGRRPASFSSGATCSDWRRAEPAVPGRVYQPQQITAVDVLYGGFHKWGYPQRV